MDYHSLKIMFDMFYDRYNMTQKWLENTCIRYLLIDDFD